MGKEGINGLSVRKKERRLGSVACHVHRTFINIIIIKSGTRVISTGLAYVELAQIKTMLRACFNYFDNCFKSVGNVIISAQFIMALQ